MQKKTKMEGMDCVPRSKWRERERQRKKFSKIAMHEEGARKVRLQGDEDGLATCSIFLLHISSKRGWDEGGAEWNH